MSVCVCGGGGGGRRYGRSIYSIISSLYVLPTQGSTGSTSHKGLENITQNLVPTIQQLMEKVGLSACGFDIHVCIFMKAHPVSGYFIINYWVMMTMMS